MKARQLYKYILLAIVLITSPAIAQISVYEDIVPLDYTNSKLNDFENIDYGTYVRLNDDESHTITSPLSKTIKASKRIQIKPDFKAHSFDNGGKFKATMCNLNRDVVCFSHADLSNVQALKKFEIGIGLPSDLEEKIQRFIETEDTINGINPYLSWQFNVELVFVHLESGYEDIVYGFYYQDYTAVYNTGTYFDGWTKQNTPYHIRARYAPKNKMGRWMVNIRIKTKENEYEFCPFDFFVTENYEDAYVKVADNNHVLEKNGKLFFPVGQNLPWPRNWGGIHCEWDNDPCGAYSQDLYRQYVNQYADVGAKSFRLLLNPYSLDVEYEKVGIYTDRLNYAWELDKIINLAEDRDLYVDFNLQLHTQFEKIASFYKFNWDWDVTRDGSETGPINQRKHGYHEDLSLSNDPVDFLTDPLAKKYFKQKLKYYISRYGYSTHISMFELFSEMNNFGQEGFYGYDENGVFRKLDSYEPYYDETRNVGQLCEDWHREMAQYIKNDIHHNEHIVKIDYTGSQLNPEDDSYAIEEIDVASWNDYGIVPWRFSNRTSDGEGEVLGTNNKMYQTYTKPIFNSETGPLLVEKCDNDVTYIRDAWMMPFSGIAGCNMWANETHPSVWHHLGNAQRFIEEDPDIANIFLGDWLSDRADNKDQTNVNAKDYLKEIVFVRNHQKTAFAGVLNNLTSNYYTERDLTSPKLQDCIDAGGDESFEEVHIEKQNLSQTSNNSMVLFRAPMGYYDAYWFDPITNQYIDQTEMYIEYDNHFAILDHPELCVTDDCTNYYPQLAFKIIRNFSKSGTVVNNSGNEELIGASMLVITPEEFEENENLTADNYMKEIFELSVYPNPTSTTLNVNVFGFIEDNDVILVTDLSGKELYKIKANNRNQLNISELATGTYLITYLGKNKKTLKFNKL